MSTDVYYTPLKHIPAFVIIHPDYGESLVEFKNPRTGKTESLPISEFIAQLLKQAA